MCHSGILTASLFVAEVAKQYRVILEFIILDADADESSFKLVYKHLHRES